MPPSAAAPPPPPLLLRVLSVETADGGDGGGSDRDRGGSPSSSPRRPDAVPLLARVDVEGEVTKGGEGKGGARSRPRNTPSGASINENPLLSSSPST